MKIGFTIGKFAPFHKGHEYLIKLAIKDVDIFYVVVYDTPQLNIDIDMKVKWIKNVFPDVKILKAYNSPKKYGLDKDSVNIQMQYLEKIIKDTNVNYFYSSEEYGRCVADYLHINNVIVDINREKINIRATDIRNDLEKYKEYLNKEVYNDIKNIPKEN